MHRKLIQALCSLLLFISVPAFSADVKSNGVPDPTRPMVWTFIGGLASNNGSWMPLLMDPVTGRALFQLPDPIGSGYIGGIVADTTIKVGAGAYPAWIDTDGGAMTAANLYKNKHLWFKLDSSGGATAGRIILRFQASWDGTSGNWFDLYHNIITSDGATIVDTLQINLNKDGAPYGTRGGWINLNNFTSTPTAATTAAVDQVLYPLNGYPFIRVNVINRTDSSTGGGAITYSYRFQGGD